MTYSFLRQTQFNKFLSCFTASISQNQQTLTAENGRFNAIDGLVLDSLIAFYGLDFLPRSSAQAFLSVLFEGRSAFGSFNFIVKLTRALFGAEEVLVTRLLPGQIELLVTNPDETRFRAYVDQSGQIYGDKAQTGQYANLGSGMVNVFSSWAVTFLNEFLGSGSSIGELIINKEEIEENNE